MLRSSRDRRVSLFDKGSGLHLVRLVTSGIWLLCHLLTSVPSPLTLLIKTLFRIEPHVRQISPDKNMNYHCTTSSFTLSPEPKGFVILCPLTPETRPYMMFLYVGSQFCAQASFRQFLAEMPLPSASSYHPLWYTHYHGSVLLQGTFTL